jgi:hypothetical protein
MSNISKGTFVLLHTLCTALLYFSVILKILTVNA